MQLNGNLHWSTAEIDFDSMVLNHFDSNQQPAFGGESHDQLARSLNNKLSQLLQVDMKFKSEDCFQQTIGDNSCGLHVIRHMELLLSGKRLSFFKTSFNPEEKRQKLLSTLEARK